MSYNNTALCTKKKTAAEQSDSKESLCTLQVIGFEKGW